MADAEFDAEDFYRLSKAMKGTAPELRKEFHRALSKAAKPVIPKVRAVARAKLPSRGGLNKRLARKPMRAVLRTGSATAGIRIGATKVDPRINNEGRVAHPVFGRKRSTVVQQVPAARGYFDDTIRNAAPEIRADLVAVLREYTDRLAAEIRG